MKRELLIAATAATIVAGVAACSSDNTASAPSASATTGSTSPSSSTPAAAGPPQLTIAGQAQNVGGSVVCATNNGRFSIAIGDVGTGVIVGLEPDGSVVHSAGLPTVDGVVLSFTEGVPGENATATKTGNAYKVTGTASGTDNTGAQVHKPFELNATCP